MRICLLSTRNCYKHFISNSCVQTAAYGSVMKTCEGHVKISRIIYEELEFVHKRYKLFKSINSLTFK